MDVSQLEQKRLCLASGNQCAFPGCREPLVTRGEAGDETITGEIAHIVAASRQGPRGRFLLSDEERNKAENLILLCSKHHKVIDTHPRIYSVGVLRQLKEDHEQKVANAIHGSPQKHDPVLVSEHLHSTLLRVAAVPAYVYSAPCEFDDRQMKEAAEKVHYPPGNSPELLPFIVREHQLYAFHDLRDPKGPFRDLVERRKAQKIRSNDMWSEDEGGRRFVDLLNRSLRRYLGVRRIRFDKVHRRYYFCALENGVEREEKYKTLTGRHESRHVVYQPKKRSTGEARDYWWHLAVGLRFHRTADLQWYLSIRPERHLTTDSETELPADAIGRKVTRLKARMYNDKYLGEVHFWRDYLSLGQPRFILGYGQQSCIVESELLSVNVTWLGVPEDQKTFTNVSFEEDLFSYAALTNATGELDEWDDEMDEEEDRDSSGVAVAKEEDHAN